MVRMTHPVHGTTHAVGAEVEWNKKNGWVVEAKPPERAAVPPSENVTPIKRGPGRPRKS